MSGDQLDLDEIQRLTYDEGYWSEQTILALVAEVRRLRAQVERSDKWIAAANPHIRDRATDEIADSL